MWIIFDICELAMHIGNVHIHGSNMNYQSAVWIVDYTNTQYNIFLFCCWIYMLVLFAVVG